MLAVGVAVHIGMMGMLGVHTLGVYPTKGTPVPGAPPPALREIILVWSQRSRSASSPTVPTDGFGKGSGTPRRTVPPVKVKYTRSFRVSVKEECGISQF